MIACSSPMMSLPTLEPATLDPATGHLTRWGAGPGGEPGAPAAPSGGEPGPLRNGNPRGDPNSAPRCGAKARTTGCPCRAPAMANGRCRLHGGHSTGPRTPEGKAATIAAHTKHGNYTAAKRAEQRSIRTLIVRLRLMAAARGLLAYLPAEMAARWMTGPAELAAPAHPSNAAFLDSPVPTTCNVRNGARGARRGAGSGRAGGVAGLATEAAARCMTGPAELAAPPHPSNAAVLVSPVPTACRACHRALDPVVRNGSGGGRRGPGAGRAGGAAGLAPHGRAAERVAALAEAAGQAPWRQAIALARAAKRAAKRAVREARAAKRAAKRAVRAARATARAGVVGAIVRVAGAKTRLPPGACVGGGETEGAVRRAAPSSGSLRSATPGSSARGHASLARGRGEYSGTNPVQRLPPGGGPGGAPGAVSRLTPAKALALRSTISAGTWEPGVVSLLVPLFGDKVPEPGWRIPQAMPAAGPVAAVVRGFLAAQQCGAEAARPEPATPEPATGRPCPAKACHRARPGGETEGAVGRLTLTRRAARGDPRVKRPGACLSRLREG